MRARTRGGKSMVWLYSKWRVVDLFAPLSAFWVRLSSSSKLCFSLRKASSSWFAVPALRSIDTMYVCRKKVEGIRIPERRGGGGEGKKREG